MTAHFTESKYGEGGHKKSKYGKGGHELGPEGAEVVRPVPSRCMCHTDTPLDPSSGNSAGVGASVGGVTEKSTGKLQ